MHLLAIPVGNSVDVVLTGLALASDDTAVTDATITATVYDATGAEAVGAVSVPHVSGGNYRGTISPSTALTAGEMYQVVVAASNYTLTWRKWFKASDRDFEA